MGKAKEETFYKLIKNKVKKYPSVPYTLYLNLVSNFELKDIILGVFIKTDGVYELRGKTSKYFKNHRSKGHIFKEKPIGGCLYLVGSLN